MKKENKIRFYNHLESNYLNLTFDDIIIYPNPATAIDSRYKDISIPALPLITAPMPSILSSELLEAMYKATEEEHLTIDTVLLPRREFMSEEQYQELIKNPYFPKVVNGFSYSSTTSIEDIVRDVEKYKLDKICIDVANGYMPRLQFYLNDLMHALRDIRPLIIAGNIVDSEYANELFKINWSYPLYLRVGIGTGSACTTSKQTGIGRGPVNILLDMYSNLKLGDCQGIIMDGGIKHSGDIVKALALGANKVMIGNLFAGVKESYAKDLGNGRKEYAGLASSLYNKTSSVEGSSGSIPSEYSYIELLRLIDGNLRSAMSYLGAHWLYQIPAASSIGMCSPAMSNSTNSQLGKI